VFEEIAHVLVLDEYFKRVVEGYSRFEQIVHIKDKQSLDRVQKEYEIRSHRVLDSTWDT